jgi:hypothetical protein
VLTRFDANYSLFPYVPPSAKHVDSPKGDEAAPVGRLRFGGSSTYKV